MPQSTTIVVVAVVVTAVVLFLANTAVITHTTVGLQKTLAELDISLTSALNDAAVKADVAALREKLVAFRGAQQRCVRAAVLRWSLHAFRSSDTDVCSCHGTWSSPPISPSWPPTDCPDNHPHTHTARVFGFLSHSMTGELKSLDELADVIQKSNAAGMAAANESAAKAEAVQGYTKAEMERIGALLGELHTGFSQCVDAAVSRWVGRVGLVGMQAEVSARLRAGQCDLTALSSLHAFTFVLPRQVH